MSNGSQRPDPLLDTATITDDKEVVGDASAAVTSSTAGALTQPSAAGEKPRSPEIQALEQFMQLIEQGPMDARSAPQSLTLPQQLYRDMMEQMDLAYDDGKEHGALFGYMAPQTTYGSVYGEGQDDQIDFSQAREAWPALKVVGQFHTHLSTWGLGTQGGTGVEGGGHSERDLVNFFRWNERASAVVCYTREGKRKIYFLLKPQQFSIPGSPGNVGKQYGDRLIILMNNGVDPVIASERELSRLAAQGAFAFYTNVGSPILMRR
jgi:hypothetical protein